MTEPWKAALVALAGLAAGAALFAAGFAFVYYLLEKSPCPTK